MIWMEHGALTHNRLDAGGGKESDTSLKAEPDEHSQQEGLFKLLPAGQLLVCLASNLVRRRQGLERLTLEEDISDDAIVNLQAEALLHQSYK